MQTRLFIEWKPPSTDKYPITHSLPLVHFYEDNTALIVYHNEFIRVPIEEVRFHRLSD